MALPLVAVVLALSAAPAAAQPVTTPVPTPTNPSSPPMSAPTGPKQTAHAVGDAGTGLGIVRILPNSAPTRTISPGASDKLPKQSAAELGFGLATAQVNSEAYLSYERAVAEAAPGGAAVQGASPQSPGAISQTAPPDNPQPVHSGLDLPSTPLDALVSARGLAGQVHAQWDEELGPCVDTISDASTEVGSVSLVNSIPTLPSVTDLTGVFDSPKLTAQQDKAVIDGLKKLSGPLSTLGGVLSGGSSTKANGSLISLPSTLSARSTVRLVDMPGTKNKAVQSTSSLQVAKLSLLAGTPFAIEIRVVSPPTLRVTSTGDARTSSVEYTAPVLEVWQGGKKLGGLDAAHPTLDVPIGIPLPDVPAAKDMPVIGRVLANGQAVSDRLRKLDLGVLRIGVAQLDERSAEMTNPFKGYQLGATARMLDLQVLPTTALGLPNLPSALAQVSLGEQVARAYAPAGGVVCLPSANPTPPPAPMPEGANPPRQLAYTTAAYKTIPLFWTGTAMLLVGVVLVAAVPNTMARPRAFAPVGVRPPGDGRDDRDTSAADAAGTNAAAERADAPPVEPATGDIESDVDSATKSDSSAEAEVKPQAAEAEMQPKSAEAAQTAPVQPDATRTEAALAEAEHSEATQTEAAATEAGATEATRSDATQTESTRAESARAEGAPTEDAQTEGAPTEGVPTEDAQTESAQTGAAPPAADRPKWTSKLPLMPPKRRKS